MRRTYAVRFCLIFVPLMIWITSGMALAQITAFTYQGKLADANNPSGNGNYDMQFKLFDTPAVGTGTQQGSTITNPTVSVSGGIFTVTLDFGSNVFTGAARYVEIGVRPAGNSIAYTVLSPRQPVTSTPYAIQTINATQLGGLPASRFVQFDVNNNIGIGTTTPSAKLTVSGAGAFNAPGAARFDLFNTTANSGFLQHVTDTGSWQIATTAGATRMLIDPSGNVGIGTNTPLSPLAVSAIGYGFTQTSGGVTVGSFVNGSGGWYGTKSNHPLFFFTNDGSPQMTVATSGNVGIGTTTPVSKLDIAAQDGLRISGFQPFLTLRDTNGGNKSSFLQGLNGDAYLLTNSRGGLVVKDITGNVGIGTATPSAQLQIAGTGTNGFTLGVEGNVTQNRDKGGFVKAMISVGSDGSILNCYNSFMTGGAASTVPCGFSVNHSINGYYDVNLGFEVSDRFLSITPRFGLSRQMIANIDNYSVNIVTIKTQTYNNSGTNDTAFHLIVF